MSRHKETKTRHSVIKHCIRHDKTNNGLKSETQNDTDIENNIENDDLNLNNADLNSVTSRLSPFISGVKSDESIATIHSHNVSKKYKTKLLQEIHSTGMFLNECKYEINN